MRLKTEQPTSSPSEPITVNPEIARANLEAMKRALQGK